MTKIMILTILLVFLISLTSAADTNNTDTTPTIKKTPNTETPNTEIPVKEKITDKKNITKKQDTRKVKQTGTTVDVSDFITLKNTLTDETYDTVTINLKSDITLLNNFLVSESIKQHTINGDKNTINGNNQHQFLNFNNANVTINNITITSATIEREEQYTLIMVI